jgi:hypothetical protein
MAWKRTNVSGQAGDSGNIPGFRTFIPRHLSGAQAHLAKAMQPPMNADQAGARRTNPQEFRTGTVLVTTAFATVRRWFFFGVYRRSSAVAWV